MVVGAGYIAVEMAGILQSLGSEVTLVIRGEKALRNFDPMISDAVTEELEHAGVKVLRKSNVSQGRLFYRVSCFVAWLIMLGQSETCDFTSKEVPVRFVLRLNLNRFFITI